MKHQHFHRNFRSSSNATGIVEPTGISPITLKITARIPRIEGWYRLIVLKKETNQKKGRPGVFLQ